MRALILRAACAAMLLATAASAQTGSPFVMAKCDPNAVTFNDVRLPQAVLADGQPLAAGTYQVRITSECPPPALGESPTAECWVEFVKSGTVAGRELASVISAEEIGEVVKGSELKPNAVRVDLLKGGEYFRVWMNSAGTHYIVNLAVPR